MGAEEALVELGLIGKWQLLTYCIVCTLAMWPSIWQIACIVFVGYTYHSYHCDAKPGQFLNQSVPYSVQDGEIVYSRCRQYKYNMSYSNDTETCQQWYYAPDYFDPSGTITQEWDLVCDRDGFVEYSQMLLNFGLGVGCAFFAPFADWHGRKSVFFFTQTVLIIFGIAMAFSTNYATWCILQFLTGAFTMGNDIAGFVLANELFPADIRLYSAALINLFWVKGGFVLVLFAYFIRHWRTLQFVISVVPISTLVYFYWCPESLRWLVINKQYDKAQAILDRAADYNGIPRVPPEVLRKPDVEDEKSSEIKPSFREYLAHRNLRLYFIIMCFAMFCTNLMSGGIGLLVQALAGDLYTNVCISYAMEVPGVITAIFAMMWFGRRKSLSFYLGFAFVMFVVAAIFDAVEIEGLPKEGRDKLVTACALCSRFGVSGAWSIELVYIQEIFPTYLRTRGTGIGGGSGFFGSALGPLALQLARNTSLYIPMSIMAALAIVSAVLVLYEPETIGRVLPTTVEEVLAWPRNLTPDQWQDVAARRSRLWADMVAGWKGQKPRRHQAAPDTKAQEANSYGASPDTNTKEAFSNPAFTPDVTKF